MTEMKIEKVHEDERGSIHRILFKCMPPKSRSNTRHRKRFPIAKCKEGQAELHDLGYLGQYVSVQNGHF